MENQLREEQQVKKIEKRILRYYKSKENLKHYIKTIEWFDENDMFDESRYGSMWFQAYLFDTQSILSTLQYTDEKEMYLAYIRKYTKLWVAESNAINPICEVIKSTFMKVLEMAKEKEMIEQTFI